MLLLFGRALRLLFFVVFESKLITSLIGMVAPPKKQTNQSKIVWLDALLVEK